LDAPPPGQAPQQERAPQQQQERAPLAPVLPNILPKFF
jgi:hypothetical protein